MVSDTNIVSVDRISLIADRKVVGPIRLQNEKLVMSDWVMLVALSHFELRDIKSDQGQLMVNWI